MTHKYIKQQRQVKKDRLHRDIVESSKNSGKALTELWEKFISPDVFLMRARQRDKRLLKFLNEAVSIGVPDQTAFEFIDMKFREHEKRYGQDSSGGQLPSLIFISSTSESNIGSIFCQGIEKVINRVSIGSAFGTAGGFRKISHVQDEASDATMLLYMLNHLLEAEHESAQGRLPEFTIKEFVAPYIPCVGNYYLREADKGKGYSFDEVAKVQLARLEKLFPKLTDPGHILEDGPKGMKYLIFHDYKFLLVPIVQDVDSRKFYVVWKEKDRTIEREEFVSFAEKNGIITNKMAQMQIGNILKHENNEFATELTIRRKCRKCVHCVDARTGSNDISGVLKELGAFPSEKRLRRLLLNEYSKSVDFYLHTNCGYIGVAIKVSALFEELQRKAQESQHKAELVERIWDSVEKIVHGKTVDYNRTDPNAVQQISSDLNLETGRETFFIVFGGVRMANGERRLDYQRALKHMYDRGIICRKGIGYSVPAVEAVIQNLEKNDLALRNQNEFQYLVTEELGRMLKRTIERLKEELKEKLENEMKSYDNVQDKKIVVRIESLKNKGVYEIPEEFSPVDIEFKRQMFVKLDRNGDPIFKLQDVFHEIKGAG